LKNRILLEIIGMAAKRLCLVVLLFALGCQEADKSKSIPPTTEKISEAELGRQLKINRDALFTALSERIRIDAASVMLFNEEPLARKILIEALEQSGNINARIAVCKALSLSRTEQKTIRNKEDFIQPLFDILSTETDDSAKLAAEAILIFDYGQIAKRLEGLSTTATMPVQSRLNAIYALRLQPDMRAVFKLIELLDDHEPRVAAEAEKALRSLGTPIGKDAEAREQIRSELIRKGRDEFFRDLLIRQEAQMRKLEDELGLWQGMYLSALDRIYDGLSDDTTKGQFLTDQLGASQDILRLWALEKVAQWRVGTKTELPAKLGPVLVNLISDKNRDVRLKTAGLLSLMGQLNSSQALLRQIEAEKDDEVKTELFAALGGACYYAFLPGSDVKVPEEVRQKTLELATKFLLDENPKKAQKGAEVLKKLLEQNGVAPMEVERCFGLLTERYKQEKDKADSSLRGELLVAMAWLCGPRSAHKAEAARAFEGLFEEAINDKADLVREVSVEGLINIDKAKAFGKLKEGFANDSSAKIRQRVIGLAGEVGSSDDLTWLAEKLGSDEGEQAWQAMLTIFKTAGADVLEKWVERLGSPDMAGKLSDEQKISFFETSERRANSENKAEMLKKVRKKLAQLYSKTGRYEQAARILGQLRETAGGPEEQESILVQLLDIYLRWPKADAAAQLVSNCLLERDLGSEDDIVKSIEKYLSELPDTTEPNGVLGVLIKVKPAENRPMWTEQVQRWTKRFGQPGEGDKSKNGG
jgi:HEAT repeat protein